MVNVVPVPIDVPPVDTLYQLIVPALAVAPSVIIPAPHRDAGDVPVITGIGLIVATTAVLDAVVHSFEVASIKNVVVSVKTGVVNAVPVPKDVPPVNTLYQFIVPALAVAPSVTDPASHLDAGIIPVIAGTALIVNMYVAVASSHGEPSGLSVVTVMVTVFPISLSAGV